VIVNYQSWVLKQISRQSWAQENSSMRAARHSRRDRRLSWTQAQVQELWQRWSSGAPASQIARDLGRGISKNAVLAKIRRLRLARRRMHDRRPSARSTIRAIAFDAIPGRLRPRSLDSNREQRGSPKWVIEAKPYADDPGADADIPPAQRRSLLELNDQTCKWPVGDPVTPDFFYCGAPADHGRPYCGHHCLRAYRPLRPNEPERDSGFAKTNRTQAGARKPD
jgi:GcrA cell cycle regulator